MQGSSESQDSMEQVFRLINTGQIRPAEQLCQQIIDNEPENINILGILGAILLKQNKIGEAEMYLQRTIDLAPPYNLTQHRHRLS